jgi:4-alpha-glucanotransferase
MKRRRAGVMIPLFSLASSQSWGIGEYRDLAAFAEWVREAGQAFIQILPITELPESETSPYSALTAMALDPIYIGLSAVEDFVAIGGESKLPRDSQESLARVRASARVAHQEVRRLKSASLRRCYEHFASTELASKSRRAQALATFCAEHAAWLDDYALFRALRQQHEQRPWWEWPAPVAKRHPTALAEARERLQDEISYRKYLQWIAAEQWSAARAQAAPVEIFGDVPFMISADSPDVWTRQDEFRFDATVGVPPDAFSETGQDWGLPPWRWDVMARNDFAWMRTRAERTAELFDGFRLDHLVGLYRTYMRPRSEAVEPFFAPDAEEQQLSLGERLVSLYTDTGAEVIAEDLGTVPDFVRESLKRLEVPGFKVMRWERRWKEPEQPFIDPADYDPVSVATTGTHDTEPLVTWWQSVDAKERAEALAMPSVQRHLANSANEMDALVRGLLDAASYLTILPIQDLFGWPDRINTPAQVSEENWSWLLPWRVDQLLRTPDARARAADFAKWTREAHRRD